MKWYRNLRISVKLISAFLIVAIISGSAGVYGIITLRKVNESSAEIFENYGNAQGYLGNAYGEFEKQRAYIGELFANQNDEEIKQIEKLINTSNSQMSKYLGRYGSTRLKTGEIDQYNDLHSKMSAFQRLVKEIVDTGVTGDLEEAYAIGHTEEAQAIISELEAAMQDAIAFSEEAASQKLLEQRQAASSYTTVMIIIAAAALVFAAGIGIINARLISRPIQLLTVGATQLAAGNTHVQHDSFDQKDEVGQLYASFQSTLGAIQALVADANMLTEAAVQGKLSTRADAGRHRGDYREIVEGINKTLDAVIRPVNEATVVLQEMAKGNLSVNVTGNYLGDHAIIQEALNDTINSIKGYIDEITFVLGQVARGDLQGEITSEFRGDFVALKESINTIIASLNAVMRDINAAAEQVASGAHQVSGGNQEISQGAAAQASSIEELSASITQITEQIKQSAANTANATDLAVQAKQAADLGNDKMRVMLASMQEINESSSNISRIIKVIDDIAFQTNILALNAAVEAARAGVHGKGFAVVAEEVRNLAARSASAANETTTLIEGSIKKVEAGTGIANETAQALASIVEGAEKSLELLNRISAASGEQTSAITQINKGIEQVSQVVQANSATAQEGAAASEELTSQAELLKDMIGNFKLKEAEASVDGGAEGPENRDAESEAAAGEDGTEPADIGKETNEAAGLNDDEFEKY